MERISVQIKVGVIVLCAVITMVINSSLIEKVSKVRRRGKGRGQGERARGRGQGGEAAKRETYRIAVSIGLDSHLAHARAVNGGLHLCIGRGAVTTVGAGSTFTFRIRSSSISYLPLTLAPFLFLHLSSYHSRCTDQRDHWLCNILHIC